MTDRIDLIRARLYEQRPSSPEPMSVTFDDVEWLLGEHARLREYAETTRYHQQRHAEAVRETEKLRARLAAVRALHKPGQSVTTEYCEGCSKRGEDGVWLRLVNYPCPTLRALDGESTKDGA